MQVIPPGGRWSDPPEPVATPVVMVADDQADYRSTVASHLALAGYPVVEAASVSAVVASSRDVRPDLVLVSDGFAGGDVAALLESLQRDAALEGVPVITLSSEPGTARLVECLARGARDHVRREAGADELVARVDALIRADDELERLRRRNAELEFLGATDALTGLANRRQIEDEYDRLRAGAVRHRLPLSIVMVRVDDLGQSGSPATTRRRRSGVVRELGFLIAAVRRADDFAGVWDDATFVVMLPMTGLEGALTFVRRLQHVVKAAPVHDGAEHVRVTVSAGCAEVNDAPSGLLFRLERGVDSVQSCGGDGISVTA